MKKFIISEEEKNRILGMHQDATKRHYLKEQEDVSSVKTSFVDKRGRKYSVPGLNQETFQIFTTLSKPYDYEELLSYLDNLGVKTNIMNNPFSAPIESVQKNIEMFLKKYKETGDVDQAMNFVDSFGQNYLSALNLLEGQLAFAILIYLQKWKPNHKGMALINDPSFQNHPTIKQVKGTITNLNEILPKVLEMKSNQTGVNVV